MAPPFDVIVLGLGFGLGIGGTGSAVAHDAGVHPAGKAATRRYSHTPDEHCVLTRHPEHPETATVACGFSGHGIKFLPGVGEIVTDLALTGAIAHPNELFDPRRPAAAAA
ncbi:hypothetical protein AB0952_05460 [Streptomyces caniferus]